MEPDSSPTSPPSPYEYKPFLGSSHTWALNSIDAAITAGTITPASRVLDIGSSYGFIGAQLKKRDFSQLFAVEIDEDARAKAAPLYEQAEASIDPFRGQKFELILLLDVLEHLADPFSFMNEISALLSPGGILLISVPNIAHWSVRIPLLFGYFNYRSRGLLDRTHLQFFTRTRAIELIQSQPTLTLVTTDASIEPVELILPRTLWDNGIFRVVSKCRSWLARTVPGLFAFQHLLVVRKLAH